MSHSGSGSVYYPTLAIAWTYQRLGSKGRPKSRSLLLRKRWHQAKKRPPRGRPLSGAPAGPTRSIAIMIGLERTFRSHADVGGLLLAQLGQFDAELVEVKPGNLLVEMLG